MFFIEESGYNTTYGMPRASGMLGTLEYRSCSDKKENPKTGEITYLLKVLSDSSDEMIEVILSTQPTTFKKGDPVDLETFKVQFGTENTAFAGKMSGSKIRKLYFAEKVVKANAPYVDKKEHQG